MSAEEIVVPVPHSKSHNLSEWLRVRIRQWASIQRVTTAADTAIIHIYIHATGCCCRDIVRDVADISYTILSELG